MIWNTSRRDAVRMADRLAPIHLAIRRILATSDFENFPSAISAIATIDGVDRREKECNFRLLDVPFSGTAEFAGMGIDGFRQSRSTMIVGHENYFGLYTMIYYNPEEKELRNFDVSISDAISRSHKLGSLANALRKELLSRPNYYSTFDRFLR